MTYALRFENVQKRYPRGGPGYASVRHDLLGRLKSVFRPGARSPRGNLALDDVSFEVEEGESFAIVGPNGAGKTTALKLVSRISYPTGGRVSVRGRVGALIEVGSGIHPELNARENIWLYGQILGMSRKDVARRFDEIVDFAELGAVLERPVKMYSSGMQLRLGFSIASHLDPHVFVVDEALAVGDAGFQAKCVERMSALVASGRTLVFVSHTLPVVREVCRRGLLLEGGKVVFTGTAEEVVDTYLQRVGQAMVDRPRTGGPIEIAGLRVYSGRDGSARIATYDPVTFEVSVECVRDFDDIIPGIAITDGRLNNLVTMTTLSQRGEGVSLRQGLNKIVCNLRSLPLYPGNYELMFVAGSTVKAVNYVSPMVIGMLIVSEGPEGRRGDVFSGKGGFGPVSVDFDFIVGER